MHHFHDAQIEINHSIIICEVEIEILEIGHPDAFAGTSLAVLLLHFELRLLLLDTGHPGATAGTPLAVLRELLTMLRLDL